MTAKAKINPDEMNTEEISAYIDDVSLEQTVILAIALKVIGSCVSWLEIKGLMDCLM